MNLFLNKYFRTTLVNDADINFNQDIAFFLENKVIYGN